jgi:hypothetical protein
VEAQGNEPTAAIKAELLELIEAHSDELAAMLVGRYLRSELGADLDPESAAGLRLAASEVVKVLQLRLGEDDVWPRELPPGIAVPIQYMAREGWPLDRVLRGLTLVSTTFGEFVVERLDQLREPEATVRYIASLRGLNDDRMMAAFAAEYEGELERLRQAPSRRLVERIEGLLEGGLGDFADLKYRLEDWHVGLILMGPNAELDCRRLAERLGCQMLALPRPDEIVWAWLGAPRLISFGKLEQAASGESGPLAVAAGEPRHGLDGWRTTHREARAAATVAALAGARLTRYSDVALLASCLINEVAAKSLLDRFLHPVHERRDGEALRGTLRTYLDLDCNAASAAAALHVDRHTVQRRLRRIEESVGEPISTRRTEFDVALRLEALTATLSRLAEGEEVDHVVPIKVPARTVLAHPSMDPR